MSTTKPNHRLEKKLQHNALATSEVLGNYKENLYNENCPTINETNTKNIRSVKFNMLNPLIASQMVNVKMYSAHLFYVQSGLEVFASCPLDTENN